MTTPADHLLEGHAPAESNAARCAVCGAARSRLVHEGARYAPEATIRRCAACGLVFYWPRPSPAELAEYYAREYRKEYDGATPLETTYRQSIQEARARAERVRPLVSPESRLLEIGASCGSFLDAVRPFVGSVTGVEPGDEHREWGRSRLGLEIAAGLAELHGRRFDAIVLFHTLEHLPDPVQSLRELSALLAPGGCIVIEVPNVEDALVTMFPTPAFLRFYYQRAHLYYFSPETLARTIAEAGGRARVTGVQRYDLSNHLRWLETGAPGGHGYFAGVLTPEVNGAYAEALIRAGKADTLWAVATFDRGVDRAPGT